MEHDHARGGIETGYDDFDELTGGLHKSELTILAARPSMGKTALAMNMAEHAATKAGSPTLFVSLEMSAIELGDRLLCSAARVKWKWPAQWDNHERGAIQADRDGRRNQPLAALHRRFAKPHDDGDRSQRPPFEAARSGSR